MVRRGGRPPIIGITTYGPDAKGKFALPATYVDAVRRAGGVPVLVPPGEVHLEQLFAELDGLVLSGGGDVDPELYVGVPHAAIDRVDCARRSSPFGDRGITAQR